MTSARQRTANVANATRSTGPRTKGGKAISRSNALRHGLAIPVCLEPGAEEEIHKLAGAILGGEKRPDLVALARRIAEAEIDLRRIWRARMLLAIIPRPATNYRVVRSSNAKLFDAAARRANRRKNGSIKDLVNILQAEDWSPDAPDWLVVPSKKPSKDWQAGALERYERRALSRRKSAIRAFDLARRFPTIALQGPT